MSLINTATGSPSVPLDLGSSSSSSSGTPIAPSNPSLFLADLHIPNVTLYSSGRAVDLEHNATALGGSQKDLQEIAKLIDEIAHHKVFKNEVFNAGYAKGTKMEILVKKNKLIFFKKGEKERKKELDITSGKRGAIFLSRAKKIIETANRVYGHYYGDRHAVRSGELHNHLSALVPDLLSKSVSSIEYTFPPGTPIDPSHPSPLDSPSVRSTSSDTDSGITDLRRQNQDLRNALQNLTDANTAAESTFDRDKKRLQDDHATAAQQLTLERGVLGAANGRLQEQILLNNQELRTLRPLKEQDSIQKEQIEVLTKKNATLKAQAESYLKQIADLTQELKTVKSQKDKEMATLKETLCKTKQAYTYELNQLKETHKQQLDTTRQQLENKESILSLNNQAVNKKNLDLTSQIAVLTKSIAELEQLLSQKNEKLEEKDRTIAAQAQRLVTQEAAITSLTAASAAQAELVAENKQLKQQPLAAQTLQINTTAELQALKENKTLQETTIADLQAQLETLQREAIANSESATAKTSELEKILKQEKQQLTDLTQELEDNKKTLEDIIQTNSILEEQNKQLSQEIASLQPLHNGNVETSPSQDASEQQLMELLRQATQHLQTVEEETTALLKETQELSLPHTQDEGLQESTAQKLQSLEEKNGDQQEYINKLKERLATVKQEKRQALLNSLEEFLQIIQDNSFLSNEHDILMESYARELGLKQQTITRLGSQLQEAQNELLQHLQSRRDILQEQVGSNSLGKEIKEAKSSGKLQELTIKQKIDGLSQEIQELEAILKQRHEDQIEKNLEASSRTESQLAIFHKYHEQVTEELKQTQRTLQEQEKFIQEQEKRIDQQNKDLVKAKAQLKQYQFVPVRQKQESTTQADATLTYYLGVAYNKEAAQKLEIARLKQELEQEKQQIQKQLEELNSQQASITEKVRAEFQASIDASQLALQQKKQDLEQETKLVWDNELKLSQMEGTNLRLDASLKTLETTNLSLENRALLAEQNLNNQTRLLEQATSELEELQQAHQELRSTIEEIVNNPGEFLERLSRQATENIE